ncbi:MAG: CHAT domain-containing tetratricopeptide repeat protein, partial [Bacteroidota bacterium]
IGSSSRLLAEYNVAKSNLEKALEIRKEKLKEGHPYFIPTYGELASLSIDQGKYRESLKFSKKALETALILRVDSLYEGTTNTLHRMGIAYKELEIYDSAMFYFKREEALNKEMNFYGRGRASAQIGMIYEKQKKLAEADSAFSRAIKVMIEALGGKNPELPEVYTRRAQLKAFQANFKEAHILIDKSLDALNYSHPDSLSGIHSLHAVIGAFHVMGNIYYLQYKDDQNINWLRKAKASYQEGLSVLHYMRKNLPDSPGKNTILQTYHLLYESLLNISRLLSPESAETFALSEQSKAYQLKQSFLISKAQEIGGVDQDILDKELRLQRDLTLSKNEYFQISQGNHPKKDSLMRVKEYEIYELEKGYNEFVKGFETSYPSYYQLKYDTTTLDIAAIQDKLLKKDQALIEYFVGDSTLYIFLIQKEDFRIIALKKNFPLEDWISNMRIGIYDDFLSTEDRDHISANEKYVESAWNIYQKIVLPVDTLLADETELIIIPDGVLNELPFEALLTEKPQYANYFKTHAYLLKSHTVSYCYSVGLLNEMYEKAKEQQIGRGFLAVAPSYKSLGRRNKDHLFNNFASGILNPHTSLDSFPNNKATTQAAISQFTDQLDWVGRVSDFKKQAHRYRGIHLSTHALANSERGDFSQLLFEEGGKSLEVLYASELYGMKLNAEMVVLSACETAIGEQRLGEGIISLARAFSYAGTQSIITSLWTVNIASTQELMGYFYSYLDKGKSKSEALRLAKLAYLENSSEIAPYHWAGFIGIGNMGKLEAEEGVVALWEKLILVLGLIVLAIFVYRRRGRNG